MGHAQQTSDQGPVGQIKGQRGHSGKQENKARDQKRKAKQQKKKELLPSPSLTLPDSLFFFFFFTHSPCKSHPLPIPNSTIEKIRGRQRGMEEQQHACTRNLKNI